MFKIKKLTDQFFFYYKNFHHYYCVILAQFFSNVPAEIPKCLINDGAKQYRKQDYIFKSSSETSLELQKWKMKIFNQDFILLEFTVRQ